MSTVLNTISLRDLIDVELGHLAFPSKPIGLYEPMKYILTLGGKRTRPILAMMSAKLFSDNVKEAIPVALAVEIFHNFTLVHDDIMDNAPLRRCSMTVHEKWDVNTAILSGDAMMVNAYQLLSKVNPIHLPTVLEVFNKAAKEVCEGQQHDVDFSEDLTTGVNDYLKMIELKTAVLIAASFKLGGIVGGGSETDFNQLYEFGKNIGIAFQLQDDLLDIYGDPEKFGKQQGGDVIEKKKTFLYLTALAISNKEQRNSLIETFDSDEIDSAQKVKNVKKVYDDLRIDSACKDKINLYYQKAMECMKSISVDSNRKKEIIDFVNDLRIRER